MVESEQRVKGVPGRPHRPALVAAGLEVPAFARLVVEAEHGDAQEHLLAHPGAEAVVVAAHPPLAIGLARVEQSLQTMKGADEQAHAESAAGAGWRLPS